MSLLSGIGSGLGSILNPPSTPTPTPPPSATPTPTPTPTPAPAAPTPDVVYTPSPAEPDAPPLYTPPSGQERTATSSTAPSTAGANPAPAALPSAGAARGTGQSWQINADPSAPAAPPGLAARLDNDSLAGLREAGELPARQLAQSSTAGAVPDAATQMDAAQVIARAAYGFVAQASASQSDRLSLLG